MNTRTNLDGAAQVQRYTVHTKDTAPADSKPLLEGAEKKMGMVPNLLGVLAESPAAVNAYLTINESLARHSAFDEKEIQLLAVAVSRENRCEYCVSVHSAMALQAGLPRETIDAIRDGKPLSDERLEALRRFSTEVVQKRGWVSEQTVQALHEAGFSRQQVLEVVAVVAMKTLSNYTNHMARTPLDEAFASTKWTAPPDGNG